MSGDIKGAFILLIVLAAVMFFGRGGRSRLPALGPNALQRVIVPLAGDISGDAGGITDSPYQTYGPPWLFNPPVDMFIGQGAYN